MQYTEYLEKYLHHFYDYLPSNEAEISKAESELGITFPLAMRNFLLVTGGDYNDLLMDIGSARLRKAKYNKDTFEKLLIKYNITFTDPVFVFSADDECFFIKLNTGDDPEVWKFSPELYDELDIYMPGYTGMGYQQGFYKMDNRLSAYLIALVNERLVDKMIKINDSHA